MNLTEALLEREKNIDRSILSNITALEIVSVSPDSLYLGEQAEVTALLSGEVDGVHWR